MAEKDFERFPKNTDEPERDFDFKDSAAWLSNAEDMVGQGKAIERMIKDKNGDHIFEIRALNADGSQGELLVWINMKKFMELTPTRAQRAVLRESIEDAVVDEKLKALGDRLTRENYGTSWASAPENKQVPVIDEKIRDAIEKANRK